MASRKERKQDTSRTAQMTARKKKEKINVSKINMLMPWKIYAPTNTKKNKLYNSMNHTW